MRKELFCDGRINCAWPYSEPADEVYCREAAKPKVATWSMSDLPVIVLVVLILLAILTGLGCALRRFSSHEEKFTASAVASSRQVISERQEKNSFREIFFFFLSLKNKKIYWVGPIDNNLFTNKLQRFVK